MPPRIHPSFTVCLQTVLFITLMSRRRCTFYFYLRQLNHNERRSIMSNPGGAGISTEQLKARYIGTGHTDMSKYEWLTNQHRDTYASHIGHYDQLSYFSVAQNESIGRVRLQFLERMVQPCGPPPPTKNVDRLMEEKAMSD
jgi:splicing factor 3B subunit 5